MYVDKDKCAGCGECVRYCPMGVIKMNDNLAEIDFDECVECFNCYRSEICPVYAITPHELKWPRSIRRAMSDPQTLHDDTGISGRGTAEMKTNEITDRIKFGFIGVGIELGRPNLGTRLYDVEKVAMAIAPSGITFEKQNPVTGLMTDPRTGKMKNDILNEKVLTAIVEGTIPVEKLESLLGILEEASHQINTVMSVGLSSRVYENGSLAFDEILERRRLTASTSGKVNIGLGRPL